MYALVPFVTVSRGKRSVRRPFGYDMSPYNFITVGTPKTDDQALIWYDDPVVDAKVTKIADDKGEILATSSKNSLEALVGDRSFKAQDTIQVSVLDILANPPKAWGRQSLQPELDGLRIWLGPGGRGQNLFHEESVKPSLHSKVYLDDFNRGNGNLDASTLSGGGTTWDEVGGTTWAILSNRASSAVIPTGNLEVALTTTDTDTDSMFAEAQLVTFTRPATTELSAGMFVGLSSTVADGYLFQVTGNDSSPIRLLQAIGQDIELTSDTTAPSTGNMKIIRDGSSVAGYFNDALILGPSTDTGETSGAGFRLIGMGSFWEGASGTRVVEFDSFVGGDYPAHYGRNTRAFPLGMEIGMNWRMGI